MVGVPGRNGGSFGTGSSLRNTTCLINMPYVHDFGEGDRFVPRWISLGNILGNLEITGYPNLSLRDFYNDRTTFYDDVGDPTPYDVFSPLDPAANDIISGDLRYSYYLDRNMIRYMTSNESQLPPLTNLSQLSAQRLCEKYEVELGSQDLSGSFTAKQGSRKTKQLPSKKHMVAFSQWPDTFRPAFNELTPGDMGHMERIVDGTTLNSAQYTGEVIHPENISCNVDGKNIGGSFYNSGTELTSNLANEDGEEILTGSSVQRSEINKSTEGCMSRFGVQDFVGNVPEVEVGRYDCDTSEEELLYGPIAGPGRYNNSVLGNDEGLGFRWSIHALHSGYSAWVQSGNNTGQCSGFADGSVRTGVPFTIGGDINPSIKFDGSVNTDLINMADPPLDNYSVDDMRDGFGTIWDTGQNAFSPPVAANGTFSLELPTNKYFSPAVGVPLNTNIEDVIDYNGGNINPYRMWFQIGIDKFFTNNGTIDEDDFWIPYFPVGQSQMNSVGMSAISDQSFTYTVGLTNQSDFDFAYQVTVGSPAIPTNNTFDILTASTWGGGDITAYETRWALERSVPTTFVVGGDHDTTTPGRYNASFNAATESEGIGARCLVRVPSD